MSNYAPLHAIGAAQRRKTENRLRLHADFMQRLEALGCSRKDASRRAFQMVKAGGKWIEPTALTSAKGTE